MSNGITLLAITAASIGFFHTLFGPDHYLPFIMMSKARNWSTPKTMLITFLCGLGHVGSSVILGIIGVSIGIAITKIEIFESFRGNLAAWILFTIFVLGPCEPLIPILMYPAAKNNISGLILITLIFATVTITTMMVIVFVTSTGIKLIPMKKMEKYSHALAGAIILFSGLGIQFLGL